MATHFAAISTTAWIAHQALPFDWEYSDPIEPLWESLVEEAGEADRSQEALRHVMEWAWSNQDSFFDQASPLGRQPNNGWAGRWDKSGSNPSTDDGEWEWIGFVPSRLTEILESANFESVAITRTWFDQGWLSTNDTNRRTRKARIGRERSLMNLIAIKRSAVRSVMK
ncbi:hypothetical protein LOC68_01775 [Blastopirellula sp. JC732]|uniref:Cch helix turn helix domain-containing protein n=1 Tax=Blastopirellula sediminis TaxID=2894196 RepID=A0A9X1MKG1_9BACT|nr:hypothetical protein [Blastopirellula sediminis]MCC9608083.1 hypothetical protein [Blastopirellula sediminis]MCC9627124.1 hypothetical protein [Blastopirellula sediminis]